MNMVPSFAYLQNIFAPRSSAINESLLKNPHKPPNFVRNSPVAQRYLDFLGILSWDKFPERELHDPRGKPPIPYLPFVAACLVKLDQGFTYMSQLRRYLVEHPALLFLLGFPIVRSCRYPWGFDADASLPTHRHFTRMMRTIPNRILQFLLDDTVCLLIGELGEIAPDFGQVISLDTKHIIAWVKENNPKAYHSEKRFDKNRHPKGDPDCRLGCKRRRNQRLVSEETPATPTNDAVPAKGASIGEYYWGYGSGVVATKVPAWGEFVLAEFTQPFNHADVSYFFPLMADVQRRLGFRPRFGAFDAAFDAFYVYEYFHRTDDDVGFAAVPFSQRGGHRKTFDKSGLPFCTAGLSMPLRYRFICRTELVEHERGRYHCPLFYPEPTGKPCPVNHKNYAKEGCITTLATSIGARIRYQLDRQSEIYKQVYKQRTATERINSQALALGIERPKIRNGHAIANLNTLIYTIINLRALHRIRLKKSLR
jgi:hypothetical protein